MSALVNSNTSNLRTDGYGTALAQAGVASPKQVKALLNERLAGIVQQVTGMSLEKAARYKDVDKIAQLSEFRFGGNDYKSALLIRLNDSAKAASSGRYGLLDVVNSTSRQILSAGLVRFVTGIGDALQGKTSPAARDAVKVLDTTPNPLTGGLSPRDARTLGTGVMGGINQATRKVSPSLVVQVPGTADDRAVRSLANKVLTQEIAKPEYAELRARIKKAGPVGVAAFARVYDPSNAADRKLEARLDRAVKPANSIGITQVWQTLSARTERPLYDRVAEAKYERQEGIQRVLGDRDGMDVSTQLLRPNTEAFKQGRIGFGDVVRTLAQAQQTHDQHGGQWTPETIKAFDAGVQGLSTLMLKRGISDYQAGEISNAELKNIVESASGGMTTASFNRWSPEARQSFTALSQFGRTLLGASGARNEAQRQDLMGAVAQFRKTPNEQTLQTVRDQRDRLNDEFNSGRTTAKRGPEVKAALAEANQVIARSEFDASVTRTVNLSPPLAVLVESYRQAEKAGDPIGIAKSRKALNDRVGQITQLEKKAAVHTADPTVRQAREMLGKTAPLGTQKVSDLRDGDKRATYVGISRPDGGRFQARLVDVRTKVGLAEAPQTDGWRTTYRAVDFRATDKYGTSTPLHGQSKWDMSSREAATPQQAEAAVREYLQRIVPNAVRSAEFREQQRSSGTFETANAVVTVAGGLVKPVPLAQIEQAMPTAAKFLAANNKLVEYRGTDIENFVGMATNLAPTVVPAKGAGPRVLFEGQALEQYVKPLAEAVRRVGGTAPEMTAIPVFFRTEGDKLGTTSLLRVKDEIGNGERYIDNVGNTYRDLAHWKTANKLPATDVFVPAGGRMTNDAQGRLQLEAFSNQRPDNVALPIVRGGVALLGAGAGVAAIVGSGGLAAPIILAGASAFSVLDGAYTLKDTADRGKPITLRDEEVRASVVNIASGALGIGAVGTAGRVGRMFDAASNVADGLQTVDGGRRFIRDYKKMGRVEQFASGAQMLFSMAMMGATVKGGHKFNFDAFKAELTGVQTSPSSQPRTVRNEPTPTPRLQTDKPDVAGDRTPAAAKPVPKAAAPTVVQPPKASTVAATASARGEANRTDSVSKAQAEETAKLASAGFSIKALPSSLAELEQMPAQVAKLTDAIEASKGYWAAGNVLSDYAKATGIPYKSLAEIPSVRVAMTNQKEATSTGNPERPVVSMAEPPPVLAMFSANTPNTPNRFWNDPNYGNKREPWNDTARFAPGAGFDPAQRQTIGDAYREYRARQGKAPIQPAAKWFDQQVNQWAAEKANAGTNAPSLSQFIKRSWASPMAYKAEVEAVSRDVAALASSAQSGGSSPDQVRVTANALAMRINQIADDLPLPRDLNLYRQLSDLSNDLVRATNTIVPDTPLVIEQIALHLEAIALPAKATQPSPNRLGEADHYTIEDEAKYSGASHFGSENSMNALQKWDQSKSFVRGVSTKFKAADGTMQSLVRTDAAGQPLLDAQGRMTPSHKVVMDTVKDATGKVSHVYSLVPHHQPLQPATPTQPAQKTVVWYNFERNRVTMLSSALTRNGQSDIALMVRGLAVSTRDRGLVNRNVEIPIDKDIPTAELTYGKRPDTLVDGGKSEWGIQSDKYGWIPFSPGPRERQSILRPGEMKYSEPKKIADGTVDFSGLEDVAYLREYQAIVRELRPSADTNDLVKFGGFWGWKTPNLGGNGRKWFFELAPGGLPPTVTVIPGFPKKEIKLSAGVNQDASYFTPEWASSQNLRERLLFTRPAKTHSTSDWQVTPARENFLNGVKSKVSEENQKFGQLLAFVSVAVGAAGVGRGVNSGQLDRNEPTNLAGGVSTLDKLATGYRELFGELSGTLADFEALARKSGSLDTPEGKAYLNLVYSATEAKRGELRALKSIAEVYREARSEKVEAHHNPAWVAWDFLRGYPIGRDPAWLTTGENAALAAVATAQTQLESFVNTDVTTRRAILSDLRTEQSQRQTQTNQKQTNVGQNVQIKFNTLNIEISTLNGQVNELQQRRTNALANARAIIASPVLEESTGRIVANPNTVARLEAAERQAVADRDLAARDLARFQGLLAQGAVAQQLVDQKQQVLLGKQNAVDEAVLDRQVVKSDEGELVNLAGRDTVPQSAIDDLVRQIAEKQVKARALGEQLQQEKQQPSDLTVK